MKKQRTESQTPSSETTPVTNEAKTKTKSATKRKLVTQETHKVSTGESSREGMATTASGSTEKFTFFYRTASPFSQFHPSKFHGKPLFKITPEDELGYQFLHCEQWMMFNKAKLFNDEESAKKILATEKPPGCKALGRKVKNFDEKVWIGHNQRIILEGNRLKFTQNPNLLKELLNTDGTTLVEASPTDRVYGIGLDSGHPDAQNRATWRGKNLLGEALTKLREELKLQTSSD